MLTPPPRHVVEHTDDGSPTVRDTLLGCTFHSRHGALSETMHVFIDAGLRHWLTLQNSHSPHEKLKIPPHAGEGLGEVFSCSPPGKEGLGEVNSPETLNIKILEVGFGSGLNVAATLATFPSACIQFTTIDKFPLGDEAQEAVVANSPEAVRKPLTDMLHCDWETEQAITPSFTLKKIETDLLLLQGPLPFDVCYFDAFAPSDQPELWTVEVFQKLLGWAHPGAILVTYCSKGDVRRAMQVAGWSVQKLPGPRGKREMLRAVKRVYIQRSGY